MLYQASVQQEAFPQANRPQKEAITRTSNQINQKKNPIRDPWQPADNKQHQEEPKTEAMVQPQQTNRDERGRHAHGSEGRLIIADPDPEPRKEEGRRNRGGGVSNKRDEQMVGSRTRWKLGARRPHLKGTRPCRGTPKTQMTGMAIVPSITPRVYGGEGWNARRGGRAT